ncbi:hypothetical protein [Undibacterium sp.]
MPSVNEGAVAVAVTGLRIMSAGLEGYPTGLTEGRLARILED